MAAPKISIQRHEMENATQFDVSDGTNTWCFEINHGTALYHDFAVQGFIRTVRNQGLGAKTSPEAIKAALDSLNDALKHGQRTRRAPRGSGKEPSLLVQALILVAQNKGQAKSKEEVEAFVGKLTRAQAADLRNNHPEVREALNSLRPQATVDLSDLF